MKMTVRAEQMKVCMLKSLLLLIQKDKECSEAPRRTVCLGRLPLISNGNEWEGRDVRRTDSQEAATESGAQEKGVGHESRFTKRRHVGVR